MKKTSLAVQFRQTFVLIVILSIIASITTIALSAFLLVLSMNKTIYPPNFYEKQIPFVEAYIRSENVNILLQSGKSGIEDVIQGDGLFYQVVDNNGDILYGTFPVKLYETKEELLNELINLTVLRHKYYVKTVPIEENGGFKGAVLLAYKIKMTFINTAGKLVAAFFSLSLISPFIYLFGFTLIISKKFSKEINYPLQLLAEASRKIKDKNLDFEIEYHSDNELGKLCEAFSDMQIELKKSLSTQWKMEQERSEMVASLAHDLKSPLSIIMGYTDALIEDNSSGNEELKEYLTIIRDNTERSANLVRQMQYISDLERKSSELCLTPINLKDFLQKKVNEYTLQAIKKGINLTWIMQPEVHCEIQIDTDKLTRIFDNIISNSLQYTPHGGHIDIDVRMNGQKIVYKVSDTGCGFSPKDLRKATQRFYRGDEARLSEGNHSGLGLYIVKQLVEQLGGTLQIKNGEFGGACVMFYNLLII